MDYFQKQKLHHHPQQHKGKAQLKDVMLHILVTLLHHSA